MAIIPLDKNNILIRKLISSSTETFKNVFQYYQSPIFNYIYYKLGNAQAAEDIAQEVFMTLWQKRDTLKENLSLKSYLYTLAKNQTFNYQRHHKIVMRYQQAQKIERANDHALSPHNLLEEKDLHENILKAAENLPEMQRIVFMMSRFEDLSNKEIAERLDIGIKTVETHIGRALKKIAALLKYFL